ncbi:ATP-binding protein [Dyella monticola]|nr:ATP-binding protein [Dyella monticola]
MAFWQRLGFPMSPFPPRDSLRSLMAREFSAWLEVSATRSPGIWSFVSVLIAILVPTAVGLLWIETLSARNLSLLFLIGILYVGVRHGMWTALFAALPAFLSYNFFIVKPRFSLSIAPGDILAFTTFLIGALLVGGLAGRLSDRAREAKLGLRNITSLFEASRDLSGAIDLAAAAERLLWHLENAGCRAAIWIADAERLLLYAYSTNLSTDCIDEMDVSFLASDWVDEIGVACKRLRLRAGDSVVGGAVIWPLPEESVVRLDQHWIQTLLELGAVAIDRARLITEIADTRIIAEKEGLRTALLSSLSHDLRTPIATILASATSLQEHDENFDAATRLDLLGTIQDQAERLNRFVLNLLEMTRLESGALRLNCALIDPGEAMASSLKRLERQLGGHRWVRVFDNGGRRIYVDPVLIEQALVNVIENAIEHAPFDSTIAATITSTASHVMLSVEDEGPGIPAGEIDRVFDKFFSGHGDRRRASGVGLGLSVTRGLIESFGGSVQAVSPTVDDHGTRIDICLPAHPALETTE